MLKGELKDYEKRGFVKFHKLSYGVTYDICGLKVTAFKGNHKGNVGENSALYLIQLENGKTLFYGLDSGPYFEETFEALKDYKIDIFISECTAGVIPPRKKCNHLYINDVFAILKRLYTQGTVSDTSQVYLTHINHNSSYEQILNAAHELDFLLPVTVAYDGLELFDKNDRI